MKKGDLVRVTDACHTMQGFVGLVLSGERTIPNHPEGMKFYDVLVSGQVFYFPDFWLEVIDEEG